MMMEQRRRIELGIYVIIFLLLISCSTTPKKIKGGSSVIPRSYTILISGMKFNPQEIKVHKGDTLIWKNEDMVPHCVTEMPDKTWTSMIIAPGGSWKMAVTKGSDYYCAIHQVMTGKIIVE